MSTMTAAVAVAVPVTVLVLSLIIPTASFSPRVTVVQNTEAKGGSTTEHFASPDRRKVLDTICGSLVCTAYTFSKAAFAADGEVVVETKSPLIAFFKNFLPSDKLDSPPSSRTGETDDPLDSIAWDGAKKRGLNTEQMADAINDGLREREWFVTGRGLPEYYSDAFTFSDPDVSLSGYEQYCRQVRRLFDQESARCEVICCSVTAPDTITILWRNSGRVNIGPGGITLKPYVVTTVLRTDPTDGNLIVSQVDEFDSDAPGLLLYQIPLLRPLAGPPAPSVDVLRQQCDFYTCKLRS